MEKKFIKDYLTNNNLDMEKIIKDYTSYLYKTIENMNKSILNKEDIEDIIYDTFFAMWSNENKLILDNSITSYLVAIAKNLTKKKYRNIKFEANIEDYETLSITDDEILHTINIKEDNKKLYDVICQLNAMDKKIFELYYYYNKKTKEIATFLNKNDFYIRSRLHRIRKKLCRKLEEMDYGE